MCVCEAVCACVYVPVWHNLPILQLCLRTACIPIFKSFKIEITLFSQVFLCELFLVFLFLFFKKRIGKNDILLLTYEKLSSISCGCHSDAVFDDQE